MQRNVSVRRRLAASAAVLLLLAAAGCGGGGGSGGGNSGGGAGGGTTNTAPSFTSATSVSVAENTAGTVYTAAATDAQGQAITFSISGGADAARFTITTAGALSFNAAPNFEAPLDANGDNVYDVVLSASDGAASSTLNLSITVTNSKEGVQVRRVATGLTGAVAMSVIDANRVLVADTAGAVSLIDNATGVRTRLIPGPIGDPRVGILAITRGPDFATTGTFFVLAQSSNGFVFVERYLRNSLNMYRADSFILPLAFPAPGYLGGGWMGVDGNAILVGVADGNPSGAQAPNSPSAGLGKLFRLSPNPDPYAGATVEFFLVQTIASGFRMPVGGAVTTGGLLLADRGQSVRDEVNLVNLTTGGNFGWPFREGTQTVTAGAPAGLIDPVLEYARGSGTRDGAGISGLLNYRGTIASLAGTLVIVDSSGKVFTVASSRLMAGATLAASAMEARTLDFAPDAGTINAPLAIEGDTSGAVFLLDNDGELYRLSADGS